MTAESGFINCQKCKNTLVGEKCQSGFQVWGEGGSLRMENNPAVWGAESPEIYLLGFSKGGNQNKELLKVKVGQSRFEDIPFKGMRHRLQLLLDALGVIEEQVVESLFFAEESRIQSASLVRCSLSSRDENGNYSYKMKGILDAKPGALSQIAETCVRTHLARAKPGSAFILLGLDPEYIKLCKNVMAKVFGPITKLTETTYRAGDMWFAHTAHPSSNQTDPQYKKWVEGKTQKPKVAWAREAMVGAGVARN